MGDLYISYHQFSLYKSCPAILGFRSSHPRAEADKRNATVGSCVHTLVERYLKRDISLLDMYGLAPQVLADFERNNIVLWRGRNDRAEQHALLMQNVANIELMFKEHGISPDNTISETSLKIQTGYLKIAGRIDLIQQRGRELRIFDLKATIDARRIDPDQLRVYFLLIRQTLQEPVSGTFLLTSLRQQVEVKYNADETDALLQLLFRSAVKIDTGELPMVPGETCGYCDYRDICPGASRWRKIQQHIKAEKMGQGALPWINV